MTKYEITQLTEKLSEELAETLLDLALKERKSFIETHNREPTEAEAQRIADMIINQLKIANTMVR